MADISAMVERLVSAGCDPVEAACVVAEVFTAGVLSAEFRGQNVDETAERRRAKDRDRKRLLRGNPQTSAEIRGIPEEALILSSKEAKKEKKVRERKQPLSAEFQPKDSHFEAAAKLGIPRQAVLDKCEDMRIWAKSSGALKMDWDATLHGFLRRDAPKLSVQTTKPVTAAEVDWDAQVSRFARGQAWSAKWYGPEPGQLGCRVPPEILSKYGFHQAA